MSAQRITEAARKIWLESSDEAYPVWIAYQKNVKGLFWGASDE
jgi:hypothetical protein